MMQRPVSAGRSPPPSSPHQPWWADEARRTQKFFPTSSTFLPDLKSSLLRESLGRLSSRRAGHIFPSSWINSNALVPVGGMKFVGQNLFPSNTLQQIISVLGGSLKMANLPFRQGWAKAGSQLLLHETQTVFLYHYLSIVVLLSIWTTVNVLCLPLYIYHLLLLLEIIWFVVSLESKHSCRDSRRVFISRCGTWCVHTQVLFQLGGIFLCHCDCCFFQAPCRLHAGIDSLSSTSAIVSHCFPASVFSSAFPSLSSNSLMFSQG